MNYQKFRAQKQHARCVVFLETKNKNEIMKIT